MGIDHDEINRRISSLVVGYSEYADKHTKQNVVLETIIKKQGGKNLKEPLFTWKYTNVDRPSFTNRVEDLRKLFIFEYWIEIKK